MPIAYVLPLLGMLIKIIVTFDDTWLAYFATFCYENVELRSFDRNSTRTRQKLLGYRSGCPLVEVLGDTGVK